MGARSFWVLDRDQPRRHHGTHARRSILTTRAALPRSASSGARAFGQPALRCGTIRSIRPRPHDIGSPPSRPATFLHRRLAGPCGWPPMRCTSRNYPSNRHVLDGLGRCPSASSRRFGVSRPTSRGRTHRHQIRRVGSAVPQPEHISSRNPNRIRARDYSAETTARPRRAVKLLPRRARISSNCSRS